MARPEETRLGARLLCDGSAQALTLLAVVVAWVFFRAETSGGANNIIEGMFGLSHALEPDRWRSVTQDNPFIWIHLAVLASIALLLPNSIEIAKRYGPFIVDKASAAKEIALSRQLA